MTIEEIEDKPVIDATDADDADSGAEPKSLREEIKGNLKAIKEREETDEKPIKDAGKADKTEKTVKKPVARNEPGRSDASNASPAASKQSAPAPTPIPTPAIAAPESWKSELKAKWGTLPPEVQAEVARRESEMEKKLSTMDEERHYARKMKDVVTPYMPIIQAEGGTPEGAVRDLLNTAYLLRQGTPQQKLSIIVGTAKKFGVDLTNIAQASSQAPQVDHVAIAREEANKLIQDFKQQQEMAQVNTVISAFASDPSNVHYEKVKPVMAALLSAGTAKDMKDAYDKACNADPEIRTLLRAEEDKAKEAERIAQKKAKAEAARYAASSVRGSSPLNGADVSKAPKRGLREELQANYRAATEH